MKDLIISIFGPQFGSLWSVKNKFWKTEFASSDNPKKRHPGLVVDEKSYSNVYQIAPGTSKHHLLKRHVFNVILDPENRPTYISYFLLNFSIPVHQKEFYYFGYGWWDKGILDENDLERLKEQLKLWKEFKN